jgi:hypothetical protein
MDTDLTVAYLAAHYSLPLLASDAHLPFLGAISERLRPLLTTPDCFKAAPGP